MKKTIHFETEANSGPVAFNSLNFHAIIGKRGLFDRLHFSDYMNRYEGARLVSSCHYRQHNTKVYHIEPQGVTVRYAYSNEGLVEVDLYGSGEMIGEVEEIILEAAKNFKKSPVEVPA